MVTLLQKALAEAAKLPDAEQELFAARLLAELSANDEFDRVIAGATAKLAELAAEALQEHRDGSTQILDPQRLGTRTPLADFAPLSHPLPISRSDSGIVSHRAQSI